MAKYKLKKDARQFFKDDLHEDIKSLEYWNEKNIHINLLEEVDNVHVEYGIKTSESSTSLKGWDSNNGNPKCHFHFTVKVNDIESSNYNKVEIPKVMDEVQKVLNKFFKPFVN